MNCSRRWDFRRDQDTLKHSTLVRITQTVFCNVTTTVPANTKQLDGMVRSVVHTVDLGMAKPKIYYV